MNLRNIVIIIPEEFEKRALLKLKSVYTIVTGLSLEEAIKKANASPRTFVYIPKGKKANGINNEKVFQGSGY